MTLRAQTAKNVNKPKGDHSRAKTNLISILTIRKNNRIFQIREMTSMLVANLQFRIPSKIKNALRRPSPKHRRLNKPQCMKPRIARATRRIAISSTSVDSLSTSRISLNKKFSRCVRFYQRKITGKFFHFNILSIFYINNGFLK